MKLDESQRKQVAAGAPKTLLEIRGDHNDAIFTSRAGILSAVKQFLDAF